MNTEDDQNNPNKRDGSPSRPVPHPKKQAMDDDLNEMRAAAATAAAAAAAAAGAAASVLQELDQPANLSMELTTNDTSDSEDEGGESKKYLRPPTAPQHPRLGDKYQAALPALGEVEEEGMAGGDEEQPHEQQMQQQDGMQLQQRHSSEGSTSSSSSGASSTSFSSSSRAAALIAGRVDFEEDGLGSGTRAYR